MRPRHCRCGSLVDARGLHSFVCKKARGRSARHHALNDLVVGSFASAGIPVIKEPAALFRRTANVVRQVRGESLCWDVTVICPLAKSYVNAAAYDRDIMLKVTRLKPGTWYNAT